MKSVSIPLLLVLLCAGTLSAQTFDITGSYRGISDDMPVRIVVQNEGYEEYSFHFVALEEDTPVMESELSRTGEYFLTLENDTLRLRFHGDQCLYFVEDKSYTFSKTAGTPGTITGAYTALPAEGVELVLYAEATETGYAFHFEAWVTENVFTAPMQAGNVFSLETEWGEPFTMEFTDDALLFSAQSMGAMMLHKE